MSPPRSKPWGGRFRQATDAAVERFTASIHFDQALAAHDVRSSMAHVRMLRKQGLVAEADEAALLAGLEAIAAELSAGTFPLDPGLFESGSVWTLTTALGDLDLVMSPAGTDGYSDLIRDADDLTVAEDPVLVVSVASLADVIRSKEAAGRDKDRAALPLLRRTLEESET